MKNAYFALLHSWLQQFVRLCVTLCNLHNIQVCIRWLNLILKGDFSHSFNFKNNLQENHVFHVLHNLHTNRRCWNCAISLQMFGTSVHFNLTQLSFSTILTPSWILSISQCIVVYADPRKINKSEWNLSWDYIWDLCLNESNESMGHELWVKKYFSSVFVLFIEYYDCEWNHPRTKALGKLGNIVAETLFPVDVWSCFPAWATRKHFLRNISSHES